MTRITFAFAALLAVFAVHAADAPAAKPADARRFVSNHQGVFGGQKVRYTALVEENFITDQAGKRTASLFTTSYIRTDVPKSNQRPVMFVFNGGPGSSSIWLHMGFVGPRRIDFKDVVKPETTPPFHTVDNPDSPLDVADIVLIDPVGTGFSRLLPEGKAEQFYGTAQDAKVTVEIIQRWVRDNQRWNAPKYLVSESYGTIRAAVVSRLLSGGPMETGAMVSMPLNGIILLGQAMDMGGTAGEDIRYINSLQTLAATACYHGKIAAGCTPATQVAAAKKFIDEAYLHALYAGATLSPEERESVTSRLAALLGLPVAVVRDNNLRISTGTFAKALLSSENREVGMYDGRYTLPLAASGRDPVADDPAMGQYVPGFVATYNEYAREVLGVTINDTYEPISFRTVNTPWDYGRGPGGGADKNFAPDLAVAMRRNPQLRLMVGTGYYDLVTTLGSAEYTVTHAGIPLESTEFRVYESGHMPYLGTGPREALARDVRAFVTAKK